MVEHDHIFKPEHADKLVSEERQEMLLAEKVIGIMEIKQQDVVANFGARN